MRIDPVALPSVTLAFLLPASTRAAPVNLQAGLSVGWVFGRGFTAGGRVLLYSYTGVGQTDSQSITGATLVSECRAEAERDAAHIDGDRRRDRWQVRLRGV